jgi:hypothetical protein
MFLDMISASGTAGCMSHAIKQERHVVFGASARAEHAPATLLKHWRHPTTRPQNLEDGLRSTVACLIIITASDLLRARTSAIGGRMNHCMSGATPVPITGTRGMNAE